MKKFLKEFFELIVVLSLFGGITALISYGLGSDFRGMCFWIGLSFILALTAIGSAKAEENKNKGS